MKSKRHSLAGAVLVCLLVLAMLSAGCTTRKPDPSPAIASYLQALVDKDGDRLATLSCADWEDDALTELASFDAVSVTVEGLQCTNQDSDEATAVVTCAGTIVANYGNEVLEIDLAERSYLASFEGGEWRMCGYR